MADFPGLILRTPGEEFTIESPRIPGVTYRVRALSRRLSPKLIKLASLASVDPMTAMRHAQETLPDFLAGIDGVALEDGSRFELEVEEGKLTDRCMECIATSPLWFDLLGLIDGLLFPQGDTAKNSDT